MGGVASDCQEAFHSIEYWDALAEFAAKSYLQGMSNYQAKVQGLFPGLTLKCHDDKKGKGEEPIAEEAEEETYVRVAKEALAKDVLAIVKAGSTPIEITNDPPLGANSSSTLIEIIIIVGCVSLL